jgi:6-phosphogluconolactonase
MLSLAVALGAASCNRDYTVAYLYMTTARTLPHGLVNGYKIDYQSGVLVPLADSPIDSGGRNPVTLVAAPNHLAVYTVNHDDSDVVQFDIGTDGKLYPQATRNISGSFPTAAAIDPAGKFLYVTFTYQNAADGTQLYTPANPGPGGISIFPINADNSLGTPATVNVGRSPMGIAISPSGNFLYVIDQDAATTSNLLGFAVNRTTGGLTALAGTTVNAGNVVSTGYRVGTGPSALIEDATSGYLYVTDQAANLVVSYAIQPSGTPLMVGSAATESTPVGLTFDLSGAYLYVANYGAGTIGGYTVGTNGLASRSTVAASVQVGTGPTCLAVAGSPTPSNASHGQYLFTSNQLSNSITGEQVIAGGTLEQIQGTPFSGSTLPTCLVAVPAFL